MNLRKLEKTEHEKTRRLWEEIFTEDTEAFLDYSVLNPPLSIKLSILLMMTNPITNKRINAKINIKFLILTHLFFYTVF